MKTVNIYTDGACSGNQNDENTGGWGCVLEYGETTKELWGGEPDTTNNRMEMKALIAALSALKEDGLKLNIYSDSSYLINCMKQKWYVNWRRNGWKTSQKQPVENRELWEELLALLEKHDASFSLVKGHLDPENEKAMKEAYKKYVSHNGPVDEADFRKIVDMNIKCDELANMYRKSLAEAARNPE